MSNIDVLSFKELAPNAEERIQCTLDAKRLHPNLPLAGMDITITKSDGTTRIIEATTISDIELSSDDIDIDIITSCDCDNNEIVQVYTGKFLLYMFAYYQFAT